MTVNDITKIFERAHLTYITETELTLTTIVVFLTYALIFSALIFLVYRYSTKSDFYSQTFGKTLVGISVVTTSIILAMQGSLVISLGMVGALSIVRFRTAIKSPIDLLFLFWSISVGIICGTGLIEIAVVLSAIMTFVVIGLDFLPRGNSSYILTIEGTVKLNETELQNELKKYGKNIKVRTRVIHKDSYELLIELHTKKCQELISSVSALKNITSVSLIYHDGEVRM